MYYGISLEEDIAPVSQTECVNETPLKTQTEKSQALVETQVKTAPSYVRTPLLNRQNAEISTPHHDDFFTAKESGYLRSSAFQHNQSEETQPKKKPFNFTPQYDYYEEEKVVPQDDKYEEEKVDPRYAQTDSRRKKNDINNQIEADRNKAIRLQFEQDYDQYDEDEQQEEDYENPPCLQRTHSNLLDVERHFNIELQKSKVCKLDEVRCMRISQEMLQLQDETKAIINFLKFDHDKITMQDLVPRKEKNRILYDIKKQVSDAQKLENLIENEVLNLFKRQTKSESQKELQVNPSRRRDNQTGQPIRGQNPQALRENNQMDGEERRNRGR